MAIDNLVLLLQQIDYNFIKLMSFLQYYMTEYSE